MDEMPVFVKIDNYHESVSILEKSAKKLDEAKGLLEHLDSLRQKEADEVKQVETEISIIENKLAELKKLFRQAE